MTCEMNNLEIEVCVQSWCNTLWLTGLKAPTNQLTPAQLPQQFTYKAINAIKTFSCNKIYSKILTELSLQSSRKWPLFCLFDLME